MNVGPYRDFAMVALSVNFQLNCLICVLKVEVSMQLTSGDPLFKV